MEVRENELVKVLDILIVDEKTLGYCLQAKGPEGQKRELSQSSLKLM